MFITYLLEKYAYIYPFYELVEITIFEIIITYCVNSHTQNSHNNN